MNVAQKGSRGASITLQIPNTHCKIDVFFIISVKQSFEQDSTPTDGTRGAEKNNKFTRCPE